MSEPFLVFRPSLPQLIPNLPRSAQVVYPKDIGPILLWADIFPGARVIEAGVGAGALSMALLRGIGATGQLISYEIRTRLELARVARLATRDADGRPHVIPICFVWDGSVFYSAIDHKPKRIDPTRLARLKNIRETPHVALLVDQYDEDWTRLWYVLVRGEADLVSSLEERKRAIQHLRAKYPQYDMNMLPQDSPVLRITPVRITAWGQL